MDLDLDDAESSSASAPQSAAEAILSEARAPASSAADAADTDTEAALKGYFSVLDTRVRAPPFKISAPPPSPPPFSPTLRKISAVTAAQALTLIALALWFCCIFSADFSVSLAHALSLTLFSFFLIFLCSSLSAPRGPAVSMAQRTPMSPNPNPPIQTLIVGELGHVPNGNKIKEPPSMDRLHLRSCSGRPTSSAFYLVSSPFSTLPRSHSKDCTTAARRVAEVLTLDMQVELCEGAVEWCARAKAFLRQRLQSRLVDLWLKQSRFGEALELIKTLVLEVKAVDDKVLLETFT